MAFTNLTSQAQPNIPQPSYDNLYSGVAAGTQLKAQGEATKVNLIKQGLEQFQKNQQLLSQSIGTYAAALQTNEQFASQVQNEILNKTSLGKSFSAMNSGNISLSDALAASQYATQYGAGAEAQSMAKYRDAQVQELTYKREQLENAEIIGGTATNFLGQFYDDEGKLDVNSAMTNLRSVTPETIREMLSLSSDQLPDNDINTFLNSFKNDVGQKITEAQKNKAVQEPLFTPELIQTPIDNVYVVSNRTGSKIDIVKPPHKNESKNTIEILEEELIALEKLKKDKNISDAEYDYIRSKKLRAFKNEGMGLSTVAGYAADMANMYAGSPMLADGNFNPEWIKTFSIFANTSELTMDQTISQLTDLSVFNPNDALGNLSEGDRHRLLQQLAMVAKGINDGTIDIDTFIDKDLEPGNPQ